jgi:TRAP-type C4-dicarboxylate transport system permease small subunit
MIPWLAMAGLFLAVRRRNVIRIDFFLAKFPARIRRTFRLFADLLSAAVFAYLGYVSIEYVRLFGGDQLTYLRWPTGVFSSSFVIGPVLAGLAYLYAAWQDLRGGEGVPDGKDAAL